MSDTDDGLLLGSDGLMRCKWHGNLPDYLHYHDHEWGHPVTSDHRLFEKICLEGFQSGLSWLTILRKRENFREAFHGFDFERVAKMGEADVARLLQNEGIIRHRGKIEATLNNARRAIELCESEGSLARYFWSREPDLSYRPQPLTWDFLRTQGKTERSIEISKDLKKRGWKFVGPTTVYAFMQAMGLVNDHVEGCFCRDVVEDKRRALVRPA